MLVFCLPIAGKVNLARNVENGHHVAVKIVPRYSALERTMSQDSSTTSSCWRGGQIFNPIPSHHLRQISSAPLATSSLEADPSDTCLGRRGRSRTSLGSRASQSSTSLPLPPPLRDLQAEARRERETVGRASSCRQLSGRHGCCSSMAHGQHREADIFGAWVLAGERRGMQMSTGGNWLGRGGRRQEVQERAFDSIV